jgi:hypothetical protein
VTGFRIFRPTEGHSRNGSLTLADTVEAERADEAVRLWVESRPDPPLRLNDRLVVIAEGPVSNAWIVDIDVETEPRTVAYRGQRRVA